MAGIAHPEDLIITEGTLGAQRAVNELLNLSTLTIKWDGFPAIVFGRDETGQLVLVDKHMFNRVIKGDLSFTTIRDYDNERNINRSDLWDKEDILRPALEKIIPNIKNTYYIGDLLWTGSPAIMDNAFIFKPNTVEYRVKCDSLLGDAISNSIAGIAVHTFVPGLTLENEPISSLESFFECKDITFISTSMPTPNITVNSALVLAAQNAITNYNQAVTTALTKLAEFKCKSVINTMSPFITHMIKSGDISTDVTQRFFEFVIPRLTANARAKLIKSNGAFRSDIEKGLRGIWAIWSAISNLKLDLKYQIDQQQLYSMVQPLINSSISHEGYVCGAGSNKIKIINRLEFSRANISKYEVSIEEIEEKSKMPMATFCFGRMNPPTIGHRKVIEKTLEIGGEHSFIFASSKCEPKCNPLEYSVKTEFIKKLHPLAADYIVSEYVENPWVAACWLYDKGYRHIAFVAGSDRLGSDNKSLKVALNQWNSGPTRTTDYVRGPNGREHVVLKFINCGTRDEDTLPTDTSASSTKAREYAKIGDKINFQLVTGISEDITVCGKTLYEATREGMNIGIQT